MELKRQGGEELEKISRALLLSHIESLSLHSQMVKKIKELVKLFNHN